MHIFTEKPFSLEMASTDNNEGVICVHIFIFHKYMRKIIFVKRFLQIQLEKLSVKIHITF